MKITFIVPAYNEEKRIGLCLDSVIKNLRGRFAEIIVIDNASDDRTAAIAMQRQDVKVIREMRRGLCFARECGRIAATGDYIAYIDADSQLPDGWMDIVEREFFDHPDTVCLSGPPVYFDALPLQNLLLRALWWSVAPLIYRIVGYMMFGAHELVPIV
jgi:glycosyltransferase involved in cell wall biosynthesis